MKVKSIISKKLFWLILVLTLSVWLNNTSLFVDRNDKRPILLAHRGLAQTFDHEGLEWDTNTARIIHSPEHPYLENTIPSMKAAFNYGADIVEFDVRLSKDKKLAVFHDYTLEYRTDGTGNVADHTMSELKKLDVGYGYTADGGKTYPFRGKGVGMLPSVDQVLAEFPDKELLIHIKDGGKEAGQILDQHFQDIENEQLSKLSLYGDEKAIYYLRGTYPDIKVFTKPILKKAFILYELIGWTGYIPPVIRNIEIHMPLNYAKFLWGWPDRFLQRMESVNTCFVLVDGTGGYSGGFDNREDLKKLPDNYTGVIWTNRVDKIASYFRK